MSANSYRSRRRFVHAIQFSGFNQKKLADFLGCAIAELEPGPYRETVKLPGGQVAHPNDFIICEEGMLLRNAYPMGPEQFRALYEPHNPIADGNSLED